ncbi:MAG: 4-hydroxy-tetrahydrodipicolinate reductase [Xanthomonadales bacterium]|nr:4-hydroxy-tetrahydrodipicolinate reductase [Xanthomonadales bacterium]
MKTPLNIAVLGASGRMGLALIRNINSADHLSLAAALVRRDSDDLGRDVGELAGIGTLGVAASAELSAAEVLIDFSTPATTAEWAARCADQGVAMLSGTTGLAPEHHAALASAAGSVPVLWAPNTSRGVAVLSRLVELAGQSLGMDADVEIAEAHHRYKKDSPSGTALALGERVARARGQSFSEVVNAQRSGPDAARQPGEIGISAIRAGDIVGEHTVTFGLDGERIEITHRAASRDAFVNGALHAAAWLARQPPGLYAFSDSL